MMYDAKKHAKEIAANVREEDFAFTVKAVGFEWGVYRFTTAALKRGTLVFKADGERDITISVFQSGELTKDQVRAAVEAAYAKGGQKRGNWVKGYVRNGVRVKGYYRGRG